MFIFGSLEGWPDIMYNVIDGDYPEYGPSKDNNFIICIFFIAFILVGSIFFMNLFIGTICFHFDKAHKNEKSCMYYFLSHDQNKWIEL